jgi:NADPH-dependent 2,4-dienoyl-CoA reductase/sulfur reductase-like enzyme/nitrite reductase/ring-hydroxylating ferredoxin subunit
MSDRSQTSGPDLRPGIPLDALADGIPLLGHLDDEAVILVRRGTDVSAIGATCTHWGGPLAEGLVVDETVRCPWHHACFSLRTGEALCPPALNPVAVYEVVQREGSVFVTGKRANPGTVRPRLRRKSAMSTVAIVGAGGAGNSAAEELRHLAFDGSITLVDPDPDTPYDRPNLSKDYLAGNAPEEWIPLHPRTYYHELGVDLLLGRRVTSLDPAGKRLTLDDGTTRQFDAIVLATGAEPVQLAIPGDHGPRIYYLRTLDDSRAIIRAAEGARRAVVLGASFIGLEVTAALRARNVEVHVVAPSRRPLERILGSDFGDFIRALHEQHGVVFHLGQTASGLESGTVVLQDGARLVADFVVAGVGVRPATALAEAAGLRVDNGIVVDSFLQTDAPGVYAIGDAARWPDPRGGGRVRIEHWVVAQRQGQAVARTLVGERAPFTAVPFFWTHPYDVAISYVGHAERVDTVQISGTFEARDCAVRYSVGGRVAAVATVFRNRESLEAERAFEQEVSAGLP